MTYAMNKKNWTVELVETVPATHVAISPWTALALAPVLGALLVVFLPAVGLYLPLRAAWNVLRRPAKPVEACRT